MTCESISYADCFTGSPKAQPAPRAPQYLLLFLRCRRSMRRCMHLCRPRCLQRFATFHLALGHWAVAPWNCFSCVSSLQSLEISRKFENSRPEKKLKNLEFCHHADCVKFQKKNSVPTRATTHADHLTASAYCVEPSLPRTRPFRLSLLFNG